MNASGVNTRFCLIDQQGTFGSEVVVTDVIPTPCKRAQSELHHKSDGIKEKLISDLSQWFFSERKIIEPEKQCRVSK